MAAGEKILAELQMAAASPTTRIDRRFKISTASEDYVPVAGRSLVMVYYITRNPFSFLAPSCLYWFLLSVIHSFSIYCKFFLLVLVTRFFIRLFCSKCIPHLSSTQRRCSWSAHRPTAISRRRRLDFPAPRCRLRVVLRRWPRWKQTERFL